MTLLSTESSGAALLCAMTHRGCIHTSKPNAWGGGYAYRVTDDDTPIEGFKLTDDYRKAKVQR